MRFACCSVNILLSVHYYFLCNRFAFSRNRQPTIIPIPNPNVDIGRATEMSPNDIRRVNILYKCSEYDWISTANLPMQHLARKQKKKLK